MKRKADPHGFDDASEDKVFALDFLSLRPKMY